MKRGFKVTPNSKGQTRPDSNQLREMDRKARVWRETTARKLASPWDARKPQS